MELFKIEYLAINVEVMSFVEPASAPTSAPALAPDVSPCRFVIPVFNNLTHLD